MQHRRDQAQTPGMSNGNRNGRRERDQHQEQKGNATLSGELGPVVVNMVGVERKVLGRKLLVDRRVRAEAIA